MIDRRIFLCTALGTALACAGNAWAQTAPASFPTKPVTLISPTVPGGAMDAVARLIAKHLGPRLGQSVVIDNRPGVGGALGVMQAAKSDPDGHTLVIAADSYLTVSPRILKGASLNPLKDLAPVIEIGTSPMVLVAHPSMKVRTMEEYINRIRAEPGKYTYSSAGVGSPHHLNMALLEQQLGLKQNHVPYKGGPQAFNDVLGGHAHSMFIVMSTAEPHIKAGKLVALGVSGKNRLGDHPSIPVIADVAPGYESEFWFAIFAPAETPTPIVQRLNQEIAAVISEPEVVKGMKTIGIAPVPDSSTSALTNKLQREDEKMAKLLRALGLRAD